eukprot:SAG31_NODE_253_length_19063_cov_31.913362_7_plen_121_part_00
MREGMYGRRCHMQVPYPAGSTKFSTRRLEKQRRKALPRALGIWRYRYRHVRQSIDSTGTEPPLLGTAAAQEPQNRPAFQGTGEHEAPCLGGEPEKKGRGVVVIMVGQKQISAVLAKCVLF